MAKLYGGRWKLLGSINEGGQGTVFRASDERGEFPGEWALKRLKNADRVERFLREVETLRRLGHDNIIKLVDAQVAEHGADEASYLVMPIASEGDLNKRLPIYTGHIGTIVEVALQIAAALQYAHGERIIHRDIKPGNILFPEVGHKVWVADFGISFDEAAERQTPDGEVVGPRFFIAPELEEGGTVNVTPAADIYSLGQLMFYMLSGGKRAAGGNLFDQRYADLFTGPRHELLQLLLSKMIVPLETRYKDMAVVIRELEQIKNWEQTATGGLLDSKGLAATGKLQRRIAEEMERQATHETQRQRELDLIQRVKSSVLAFLKAQLEATKAQIGAGDVLWVRVEINDAAAQRSVQIDTGNNTLLEERGFATILVRLPNDPKRTNFALRLIVCAEVNHNLPATDSSYLGIPGNPQMAVIPTYHEFSEHSAHLNNEMGYFFGKSTKYGVADPIPLMSVAPYNPQLFSPSYMDGNMSISRFNAADWPAAQGDVLKMTTDVLSRMMGYIASR